MFHFIKKNFYTLKFIINCFSRYKLYRYNNLTFIFKIYIIKVFFSYPYIRRNFFSIKKINLSEKNYTTKKYNSLKIVNQIQKFGISEKINLKKNKIRQIYNEINNKRILIYDKKKFNNFNEIKKYGLKKNFSKIIIPINLEDVPHTTNFICSKFSKSIASSYLNSFKASVNCTLFISLPKKNIKEKEKISSAQMFHFDSDFSKFLKLYLYLENVNLKNGPHVYVKGSHLSKLKKHEFQKGYSDKQIFQNYKSIETITGSKGSFFFEDAFGLHKAETPLKNHRIILNIHYGKGEIKYSKHDKYLSLK